MPDSFFGRQGFFWWIGVVESRKDPLYLGRAKVRIVGWHTEDKTEMPTEELPWAYPLLSLDNGRNSVGPKEGDWVVGFFRDGVDAQEPVMMGIIPGIPEKAANPDKGFFDPTPEEELTPALQPRPPEFGGEGGSSEGGGEASLDQFSDPNKLPAENTMFGTLEKDFDPSNYPYDVNNDGSYNDVDAGLLAETNASSFFGEEGSEFQGKSYPMSRYPLEPFLKEPTTSRLERGEEGDGHIEETIVAKKKADLQSSETADHESSGVGTDEPIGSEPFSEPETPYDAKYPFNHVYESESGHFIEVDDTPTKERLHQYHRAGTFEETHPDGTQVKKIVKQDYHIVVEDYFFYAGLTANFSSLKAMRFFTPEEMNFKCGIMNRNIDDNLNTLVGHDANTKIVHNSYTVIKGDARLLVEGNLFVACEGDIKMKAKGDVLIDGANVRITSTEGQVCLHAPASVVTETPSTSLGGVTTGEFIMSHTTLVAGALGSAPTPIYIPCEITEENDADNKDNLVTAASEPKKGFLLQEGEIGDLYKPISDSTGNAVTLSPIIGQPHFLCEAIPTGDLEDVLIQYQHIDQSITSWEVKRIVHKIGRVIEAGKFGGNGNGGRDHYRFSKPGSEYPKVMFFVIGSPESPTVAHPIVLSSERHEKK